MNIYFLVEGKRTEKKVYPQWLSHLIPELQSVEKFDEVEQNNYFIFSGEGFPSLLHNHLKNSIEDINTVKQYDYFVICLDADEQSVQDCKREILDFMAENKISLAGKTKLEIIVQNRCLETWFLGNPKIFKQNPSDDFLKSCVKFYNVKKNDPELMDKLPDFGGTVSVFHAEYLKKLLAEKNITYSKKNPHEVTEKYFLNELISRSKKTNHIPSFVTFIQFCEKIRKEITQK
jgi:hypothetical protein